MKWLKGSFSKENVVYNSSEIDQFLAPNSVVILVAWIKGPSRGPFQRLMPQGDCDPRICKRFARR
jgi:hypothetical protein